MWIQCDNKFSSQVLLLNGAKDIAAALSDMILATKAAHGKPSDHKDRGDLKTKSRVRMLL